MSELLEIRMQRTRIWSVLIILGVLGVAAITGIVATKLSLFLLVAGLAALLILQRPVLILPLIIVVALLFRVNIRTGTEVNLNLVSLLLPALLAIWMLSMVRKRDLRLVKSRTFLPLFLFMLAGVISLIIGNVTWDPFVPYPANFLLVQLAQLSIFILSAGAYLMMANLVKTEIWLRRTIWTFLVVAGGFALLYSLPATRFIVNQAATDAFSRAPLWMLLTAVSGGQLLFNRSLRISQRLILLLMLGAVGYYTLIEHREVVSVWVGILVTLAALLWLRWPKLIFIALPLLLTLLIVGDLFSVLYEFAGGEAEWLLSGISRIDLSRRVLEVSMRNPLTGLGPASYRIYAGVAPLLWRGGKSIWTGAVISSHNNYIDLFSQVGLVGLAIFLWFMAEVFLLGLRLRKRFRNGFSSGYINGALAALAGIMVIMVFADWFLPFVYNIGFHGFQASVLVWLYFGGLVALDQIAAEDSSFLPKS